MKKYISSGRNSKIVYHVGNQPLSKTDVDINKNLGLHVSFDKPRENYKNSKYISIITLKPGIITKNVPDCDHWYTLDGFYLLMESLNLSNDKAEMRNIYQKIRDEFGNNPDSIGVAIVDVIKSYLPNLQGLIYTDSIDGYNDKCLIIIDASIIVDIENEEID